MMFLFLAGAVCLSGCASGLSERAATGVYPGAAGVTIAVYPVENLSATAVPLKEVRESLIEALKAKGFRIMEEDAFQKFMARHRIRYTGGLDAETAKYFKEEAGITGVLITSVGLYSDVNPPKFALTSRLVSTGEKPGILWMDTVGMAGDDSPGILGLGLIEDPKALREKVERRLAGSLSDSFAGTKKAEGTSGKSRPKAAFRSASILKESTPLPLSLPSTEATGKNAAEGKFRPKAAFRSAVLDTERKYTVAVVPFFNRSDRKNAAELMALQFVQHLREINNFTVIEPGLIRDELLRFRIIMDQGVSLPNAEVIFNDLNADLILTGYVMDYQDYQGSYGKPKVDFSISLLDRKSKEVVWSSNSYNEGDDGVFFFDCGRVNTASVMASRMTQAIVDMIVK